jgi:hypothetical protein
MPDRTTPALQSVALFDDRPFFEKALQYGIQHGLLSANKLATLCEEAPKGMVQIARYFGTEYLRPDLERAKDRMVNLISLYLEESSGGDLHQAAQDLRDHTLLSRSKGGSDMLKALIALPQSSHFGLHERAGFQDEHIPLLAKWSLRTLPEYHAERAVRAQTTLMVEAAIWMAEQFDLDASELEAAGTDAEAVIRTALLTRLCKRSTLPDWLGFEKMVLSLRKKFPNNSQSTIADVLLAAPKDLPAPWHEVVKSVHTTVVNDLPRILDASLPVRRLFTQTPALMGRYFWCEDPLAELEHFERSYSAVWDKATDGHTDDSSLLTLFLRIATGGSHTTLLSERLASSLVKKIQKSGLDAELPRRFVLQHAPAQLQPDYLHLWATFITDAEPVLRSDKPQATADALALLRRECNIASETSRARSQHD